MDQAAQPRSARGPASATTSSQTTAATTRVDDVSSTHASASDRGERKEIDKRSAGYIARSGVAGGLAGCAVSDAFGYKGGCSVEKLRLTD